MKSKPILIGMLLLLAICLSGCVEQKEDETYRCTADDGKLYLQDGHYDMIRDVKYNLQDIGGDYTVHDGIVCLQSKFADNIICFMQDGRDLVDPEGDRWVRD